MRGPLQILAALLVAGCGAVGGDDNPVSETTIELTTGPDLVVTAISDPPPTLRLGDTFTLADTTANNGTTASATSKTVYYFSTTGVAPFNNVQRLSAQRTVPALATSATSMGTATQTLGGGLADGTYYVVACADYGNVIAEMSETNNCIASANSTIVSSPDLVENSVSNPPATITLMQTFSVTDVVMNQGTGAAQPSQTAYYLSTTGVAPFNKILRFTAQRSVPLLIATGSTSTGSTTLLMPNANTQPGAAPYANGTFYLVACADYTSAVPESGETNNCVASATTMTVTSPDLTETGATEPPADIVLGQNFSITDTVVNGGAVGTVAFENVYYLSTNNAPPYNLVLRFPTQRAVSALGASGGTNTNSVTLWAPAGYADNPAYFGTFYLISCADYRNVVAESNEQNNCRSSSGTVFVHGPDLVPSNVTISPTSADATSTVTFGDTITNTTTTAAPASEVGYYMSTDNIKDATDGIISPCSSSGGSYATRSVPALAASGGANTGTATVGPICIDDGFTVHTPAPGAYYVFVCADIYATVFETVEKNNCLLLSQQLTIGTSCGNGVVEAGEACDDHNNTQGDGCSSSCAIQTLTSVGVAPTNAIVHKGQTRQYAATAFYSDGYQVDVTASSTWTTGAAATATITSPAALLTAVDLGTTSVNATFQSTTGTTNVTVDGPVVTSLAVTPQDPSIGKFTTQQFEAEATYSDGTTATVTSDPTILWSSGTTTIATINATGLATAGPTGASGTSTITATFGGSSGTSVLTVTGAAIQTITVTPNPNTMARNTTQQYTATGNFNDGTTQDITTLCAWTSTTVSPAVATISNTGVVSANNNGSTTIRCTAQGISGDAALTVVNATLQSIAVTPATATLPKGFTLQYTAIGTFKQGATTFTQDITSAVTWTSSSTTVATITGKGVAKGAGAGTTTISATSGSVIGTASLTGTTATLSSIAITPNPIFTTKNTTIQLTATGTFTDGTLLNISSQVNWSSSSSSQASVNNTGKMRAKKVGTPTISATKNGLTGTVLVTITN